MLHCFASYQLPRLVSLQNRSIQVTRQSGLVALHLFFLEIQVRGPWRKNARPDIGYMPFASAFQAKCILQKGLKE